jgi:serine/threonine protein kinase
MDKHCVLIADDDSLTLKILKKALQELDCEIVTAEDGQQALSLCVEKRPSLIISDWHMPELDGIGFFLQIKNSPHTKHIPFVFLTTSDDEEVKIALLETGVEDYWNKPFNVREIAVRTRKILGRLGSPQQAREPNSVHITEDNSKTLESQRLLNNKYRLLDPLGKGGMGVVYLAYDETKQQNVALKLLRHEYISNITEVRRFAREAAAALRIKHPNVIETYEYGIIASGQAYIVMEMLSGISLMNYLSKHVFVSASWAAKVMAQVSSATLAAHQQGVIHRDLKPNNIFLLNDAYSNDKPRVKVLDFGIAFLQDKNTDSSANPSDSERLTDPNIIVGTPEYMSPEQIRNREVNKETDIYSLGIIFYELLSGNVPFIGDDVDVLISHINSQPIPISQKVKNLDPVLSELIMEMLAKDPKMRPSLEEIISILENYS